MALRANTCPLPASILGALHHPLSPSCSDVSFVVDAAANNTLFVDVLDSQNGTAVMDWVLHAMLSGAAPTNGTALVKGTFAINGVYCKPSTTTRAVEDDDKGVLQILLHGATYNRTYWTGLQDRPGVVADTYSWPLVAAHAGYHTLALDKLGAGSNPQRPDPINVVQVPLEVEILHQVISTIRRPITTASTSPLGRAFDKLALVGHSFGSSLGTALARRYPSDLDALVATGLSTSVDYASFLDTDFQPAAAVFGSARANARGLHPGYITTGSLSGRERTFFAGAYDAKHLPARDFAGADAATGGELLTMAAAPAVGFARPVLAVVGALDRVQCPPAAGACEDILAATGRALWPDAGPFDYHVVPDTGHCLALHFTAPETAAVVHTWLDRVFGV
ncbi:hypothetical protein PG993_000358 [Apiospora rasikravindrae]|uniref:AB hydrolase-1 domain-containing protein n=1 Tax=Apiospora rasikravindrae TaxID=990691 RepID=A0ABR1UAG1_9PEZI